MRTEPGGDGVEGGAGGVDLGLGCAAGLGQGGRTAQQVEGFGDGAVVVVAVEHRGQLGGVETARLGITVRIARWRGGNAEVEVRYGSWMMGQALMGWREGLG